MFSSKFGFVANAALRKLLCVIFVYSLLGSNANAQGKYSLTIFVDEGRKQGETFGHVFVAVSNSKTTTYAGLYPGQGEGSKIVRRSQMITGSSPALIVIKQGGSLDDYHWWDVASKSYPLSFSAYNNALAEISLWDEKAKRGDIKYSLFSRSCGDFAEAVAKKSGVGINLAWKFTKTTRPTNFAEYLWNNGGIVNFTGRKWLLSSSKDIEGTSWKDSSLIITSQKYTADGCEISGHFLWLRNGDFMGQENISGTYDAKERALKFKGKSLENTKMINGRFLVLSSYSALLRKGKSGEKSSTTADPRVIEGKWSGSNPGVWTAIENLGE